MRLGIIARGEDRGLGNQTLEACRHLDPERVLLIDPGRDGRFAQHPERFAGWDTTVARWQPGYVLDEAQAKGWLSGLDVVYTAETPYDDRLPRWAAEVGCAVVIHANVEQLDPGRIPVLYPAVWWTATPWRLDHLPSSTRVVPMPVARCPYTYTQGAQRVRFLHVAGWPTMGDRNGTKIVAEAVKYLHSDCDVIIRGQHKDIRRIRPIAGPARLFLEHGNVDDYWNLYGSADVLVLPRRFGGLSLVAQEAMASGLGLVMTDCEPNHVWPASHIPAQVRSQVRTPAGLLPLYDVEPEQLAASLDHLVSRPALVAALKQRATAWAECHTWESLKDLWRSELERAVTLRPNPSMS